MPDIAVADELRAIVGATHVLTDRASIAGYLVDWTGRWRGEATAVIRPADTGQVAAVVRWCARHRVPLVTQGGNTSLVGGAVPVEGGVVLSTRRLTRCDPVDRVAGQVTVGAGLTLEALQAHAAAAGWAFGVDLAARGSATVGGMIATNAGGTRVLRHGTMRAQVLGVEAVLGTGTVVSRLDGLVKDNTGYDLAGLLCGSEGTLGVVTAARLRLVPEPPEQLVAMVAAGSWADAMDLAVEARRTLPSLDGLEAVDAAGLDLVHRELGLSLPFSPPPVAVLVALAGTGDLDAELAPLLGDRPAVAAADPAGRARLWRLREAQSEAVARLGVPHKLDVTLPLAVLAGFAETIGRVVREVDPAAQTFVFGHLGDGNLHVNVLGPPPDDEAVDDAVLASVVALGGSISAEHGIGRAKRDWLVRARPSGELTAFRAIKAALDPEGVLNPGVLLGR